MGATLIYHLKWPFLGLVLKRIDFVCFMSGPLGLEPVQLENKDMTCHVQEYGRVLNIIVLHLIHVKRSISSSFTCYMDNNSVGRKYQYIRVLCHFYLTQCSLSAISTLNTYSE